MLLPSPCSHPLLLLCCGEGNGGLRHYPGPTPISLTYTILGTRSFTAHPSSVSPCVPFHQSGVSLVLRAVLASLSCSMVVTPWFLPSLQRWQWSPMSLGLLPFTVRSQSIRYCSMTRANSFPSHRHLRLTLIAHDGSCSWVVLGWFMTSDACVAKGRLFPERKYPATSFFPTGLLFAYIPTPTPLQLYS